MPDILRKMHKEAHADPKSRATLVPLIRVALRSQNRHWGFFGTVIQQGYSMGEAQKLFTLVGERLMQLEPRLTEDTAAEALDSRWGRHLADWIGYDFSYQIDEDVTRHADFAGFVRAIKGGRLDMKIQRHLKALSKMGGPRLTQLRSERLAQLREGRSNTSPTPEGAKSLFQKYKERHPGTKKSPQDFFDPSKPSKPSKAAPKGGLVSSKEKKLPKVVSQKVKTQKEVFEAAKVAHESQLDWLDRGKGIDQALGTKAVRGDKGEEPDFSKPGPVVAIGPLKGEKRSKEKVSADYGGDWSRLTDVVRASIAVDKVEDLHDVVGRLRKSGMKVVAQPKDRFQEPTEAGYRDLMFRVEYPNGHIGELQLHLKPILLAKSRGHKFYEEVRTIEDKAKKEGRKTLTEEEEAIVQKANIAMKKLYDEAWSKATSAPAASSTKKKASRSSSYYLYGDQPARWDPMKFPVQVVKGKDVVIYDLQKFFREAQPISQAAFQQLLKERS